MVRVIQTTCGRFVQVAPGVWLDQRTGDAVGEAFIDRVAAAGAQFDVVETPVGLIPSPVALYVAAPYRLVCCALIAGVLCLTALTVHMVHLKRDRDALAETAASWLTLKMQDRRP